MTDYRDDIDKIIDWFDFERVHRVMTELDWRWGLPGSSEVPELPELRQAARRLMNEAVQGMEQANSKQFTIETGGFRVQVQQDEEDKIFIRLAFELANWDNYE